MPLLVLPAAEAVRRAHSTQSRWPRTAETQAERLMPLAQPGFSPSFRINKQELIFTSGSCFARNIEKQLILEGYNVAAGRFAPPSNVGLSADPDALLNRYVVSSIGNELRWGLGHGKPFRDSYLVKLGEDSWFDPHLHPAIRPATLEVVRQRREHVQGYMALASQARVFIMTLGLAEAWYDTRNSLYLNGVLPTRARDQEPNRFELHVLDYGQILNELNFIRKLLKIYGHPDVRMLVTVSPVAMRTTFTGSDALVANTYSKAVQRAAVEAFVTSHDDVDYFPSFESVTLSDRRRAWRPDQAHASDEIVRVNVLRMIEAYSAETNPLSDAPPTPIQSVATAFSLIQSAKDAAAAGNLKDARRAFADAAKMAPTEALVLLEYGKFLMDQGQLDEARRQFKTSIRKGSGRYGGYYHLAQTLRGLARYEDAHLVAETARAYQPNRPGLLLLSADIARRLKRYEEALALAETCLALEPGSAPSLRLIKDMQAKIKRRQRIDTLRGGLKLRQSTR